MRNYLGTFLTAAAIAVTPAYQTLGAPAPAGGIGPGVHVDPLVQQTRVFCYSRVTGRFLHWGYCGYRYVYRYRPVYHYYWVCRNRYTGRIIHYGRC